MSSWDNIGLQRRPRRRPRPACTARLELRGGLGSASRASSVIPGDVVSRCRRMTNSFAHRTWARLAVGLAAMVRCAKPVLARTRGPLHFRRHRALKKVRCRARTGARKPVDAGLATCLPCGCLHLDPTGRRDRGRATDPRGRPYRVHARWPSACRCEHISRVGYLPRLRSNLSSKIPPSRDSTGPDPGLPQQRVESPRQLGQVVAGHFGVQMVLEVVRQLQEQRRDDPPS